MSISIPDTINKIYREGNRNIHVLSKINKENKVVHVLDMYGPSTVTQHIEFLQHSITDSEQLPGHINDYQWILYCRDATVTQFNDGSFKNADSADPHLLILMNKLHKLLWEGKLYD